MLIINDKPIKKNIILIGPVFPYKGGIAHHTSLLYKALSREHNTEIISFKVQYPDILYPGKHQKDRDNSSFVVRDTEYLINSINPLNWMNIGLLLRRRKPDMVIFQWWNPFFAPCYMAINSILKNGHSKVKTVAIAHNVLPHEKFPLQKILTRSFFAKIDHFIVHSKEEEIKLLEIKPQASVARTVLPAFNGFENRKFTKAEAKNRIGIKGEDFILLFFGFIREYKGLKYLIEAMPEIIKEYPSIRLLIVGAFYDEKKKYTDKITSLGLEESIIVRDGYLPDNEVGVYFTAADLVVLPYITATQSGVVQIAYNYGVPVIVTNTGGLPEAVEDGKTGFLVKSHSAKDIAEAVIKFVKNDCANSFKINIENGQHLFSWEVLVSIIENLESK